MVEKVKVSETSAALITEDSFIGHARLDETWQMYFIITFSLQKIMAEWHCWWNCCLTARNLGSILISNQDPSAWSLHILHVTV